MLRRGGDLKAQARIMRRGNKLLNVASIGQNLGNYRGNNMNIT